MDVQLSGIAVVGDKKLEVREAPAGQTAPKVVVKAAAIMGDVKVLGDSYATPARRTLPRLAYPRRPRPPRHRVVGAAV